MSKAISLPLWLVAILVILAAWAVFDHFFWPSLRRSIRRREKRIIRDINDRLSLKLPDFKLTKRRVLIDRLMYDALVLKAIREHAHERGISESSAKREAENYAQEIVPSFNPYLYFRLGSRLGNSLVRLLYRVRLGVANEAGFQRIRPQSSIVYIMNHRSNMDYILLGYLALSRAALSFAVGEWARVWPIRPLVKATGAFFIRRGGQDSLYRAVLARYVQLATEGGVVQAIYPEGRLSRDGLLGEPKLGLLDYMLRSFDPSRGHDLVFIPVGVNYDRVLEDRTLLLSASPQAARKPPLDIVRTALAFLFRNIWLMLRGGWHRFGYAVVNFGTPLSMQEYVNIHGFDFLKMGREKRLETVNRLAKDLMRIIGSVIPAVPVALVASIFADNPKKPLSEQELKECVLRLIEALRAKGGHVYIPRGDPFYAVKVGLRMLTLRHAVVKSGDLYGIAPDEINLVRYYANSIASLLPSDLAA